MSPLLWWSIPAVATTAAILWASWSSRTRRPEEAYDSVREFERFANAISGQQRPKKR